MPRASARLLGALAVGLTVGLLLGREVNEEAPVVASTHLPSPSAPLPTVAPAVATLPATQQALLPTSVPPAPSTPTPPTAPPPTTDISSLTLTARNVSSVVTVAGRTSRQCRDLCGCVRKAGLCRRYVWAAAEGTCTMLGSNATVETGVGSAAIEWSAEDTSAAAARFQRVPAVTAAVPEHDVLMHFVGALVAECLAECARITDSVINASGGGRPCLFVQYDLPEERCVLGAVEPVIVAHANRAVYALVLEPPASGSRERPADMALPDVAFVVLAGHRSLRTRMGTMLTTWMPHQNVLMLVEDTRLGRDHAARLIRGIGFPPLPPVSDLAIGGGGSNKSALTTPVEERIPGVTVRHNGSEWGSDDRDAPPYGSDRVAPVDPLRPYPNPHGTGRVAVAFMPEPQGKTERSFNGAWKNVAALEHVAGWLSHLRGVVAEPPQWFAMIDDDTLVFPPSLRELLRTVPLKRRREWSDATLLAHASKAPPQTPPPGSPVRQVPPLHRRRGPVGRKGVMFGAVFVGAAQTFNSSVVALEDVFDLNYPPPPKTPAPTRPLALSIAEAVASSNGTTQAPTAPPKPPQPRIRFVQGGAGIFMDAEAMALLIEAREECLSTCLQWAGDIRLGCCAGLAGVRAPLSVGPGLLNSQSLYRLSRRFDKQAAAAFPATFHQMRHPNLVQHLWRTVAVAEGSRGSLVTWPRLLRYARDNATLALVPQKLYIID